MFKAFTTSLLAPLIIFSTLFGGDAIIIVSPDNHKWDFDFMQEDLQRAFPMKKIEKMNAKEFRANKRKILRSNPYILITPRSIRREGKAAVPLLD